MYSLSDAHYEHVLLSQILKLFNDLGNQEIIASTTWLHQIWCGIKCM